MICIICHNHQPLIELYYILLLNIMIINNANNILTGSVIYCNGTSAEYNGTIYQNNGIGKDNN
jgi:hypothetical protein